MGISPSILLKNWVFVKAVFKENMTYIMSFSNICLHAGTSVSSERDNYMQMNVNIAMWSKTVGYIILLRTYCIDSPYLKA